MNAHVQIPLAEAITICKAAGYSVTKPKARKVKLSTVGPTFVAHWGDGITTRMSIHTTDEKPDVRRAVRVSLAAYESRTKGLSIGSLIDGHFERSGTVLHRYDGPELRKHLLCAA